MVKLKRTLGLFDTFSLSLGAIIGAGIFTITGARKQEYKEMVQLFTVPQGNKHIARRVIPV